MISRCLLLVLGSPNLFTIPSREYIVRLGIASHKKVVNYFFFKHPSEQKRKRKTKTQNKTSYNQTHIWSPNKNCPTNSNILVPFFRNVTSQNYIG